MQRMTRLIAIILLIALCVPVTFIQVSTYTVNATALLPNVYVSTTGNDSYNGSSPVYTSNNNGPKQTIAAGIDVVASNGTVNVAAGTYHENNIHLSETMNLVGAGALSTIIDGDSNGTVIIVSSAPFQNNTISGFTIQHGAPRNVVEGPRVGFLGSDSGGGIWISSSHTVTINDCAIINNIKGRTEPIFDGTMVGTVFSNSGWGGGVCNSGGTLYMNRCTVSGNTAVYGGGGIYTTASSGPSPTASDAPSSFGSVELTNCTISGNTVTGPGGAGGGIYCASDATIRLMNVTIANNQASGAGSVGGGFANGSTFSVYFTNCIVANNTAGNSNYNNGYDDSGTGAGTHSLGNNIDSENTCFFTTSTDQRNTNPGLGILQNNGGPTSTHAITATSPAYNRGTNTGALTTDQHGVSSLPPGAPTTDQRGVSRPQGVNCDIGAFELMNTATGTGAVSFNSSSGIFTSLNPTASTACGESLPGLTFPHGFFNFTLDNITAGSTVTVTITLPSNMPVGTQYWKCINGHWVNVTSLLGDNDGDNVLTLTLTDGGLGDADGLVNGTIVDPGAPALLISQAGQSDKPKPFTDSSSSPQTQNQISGSKASFSVKYVTIQPQQAAINQPITIAANMANNGDESGQYVASLKINGQLEQTKTGTVSAHVAQPISFTVTKDKPGTYTVDINGQVSSFTITGQPASKNTISTAGILYMVLIVMVFACIVLSMLIIKRRRDSY